MCGSTRIRPRNDGERQRERHGDAEEEADAVRLPVHRALHVLAHLLRDALRASRARPRRASARARRARAARSRAVRARSSASRPRRTRPRAPSGSTTSRRSRPRARGRGVTRPATLHGEGTDETSLSRSTVPPSLSWNCSEIASTTSCARGVVALEHRGEDRRGERRERDEREERPVRDRRRELRAAEAAVAGDRVAPEPVEAACAGPGCAQRIHAAAPALSRWDRARLREAVPDSPLGRLAGQAARHRGRSRCVLRPR